MINALQKSKKGKPSESEPSAFSSLIYKKNELGVAGPSLSISHPIAASSSSPQFIEVECPAIALSPVPIPIQLT